MRSFHNSWNLLSKTSASKWMNASQVFGSYYLSRATGKPVHSGMPFSIGIEPTTSCNLRCPECPSGLRSFSRPTGNLSEKTFSQIIDQVASHLIYLTFYFQGEPYLNPAFLDMVKYASERGIYTSTSTNAHYLNPESVEKTLESGLDRIIISIDGADQETYAHYRVGGNLEKVISGTKELINRRRKYRRKRPHVVFQFLVVKPNQHQVEEISALGKKIGVDDVLFKTAQIYDFQNGSPLIPTIEKYSRYFRNGDGSWKLKNAFDNHCWKMWHSCVVTWDGNVVPCCFDKDARHVMGNITNTDFREIWNGEAYRNFRAKILTSRKEVDICRNCTEGTKVWA